MCWRTCCFRGCCACCVGDNDLDDVDAAADYDRLDNRTAALPPPNDESTSTIGYERSSSRRGSSNRSIVPDYFDENLPLRGGLGGGEGSQEDSYQIIHGAADPEIHRIAAQADENYLEVICNLPRLNMNKQDNIRAWFMVRYDCSMSCFYGASLQSHFGKGAAEKDGTTSALSSFSDGNGDSGGGRGDGGNMSRLKTNGKMQDSDVRDGLATRHAQPHVYTNLVEGLVVRYYDGR